MFECHITVENDLGRKVFYQLLAEQCGWKTSCIDGDPLLGKGLHFYFTRHDKNYEDMFINIEKLAGLLELDKVVIIRKKIEHIMYDTKTGIGVK